VPLRLRQLGGEAIGIRPGTSDVTVLYETFCGQYHLPPEDIDEPRTILDLGANIGLTVAHFACRYSNARVLGVELDESNAALAQRNVRPWADRAVILRGAAWIEDGKVDYQGAPGDEYGFSVCTSIAGSEASRPLTGTAPAFGMTSLIAELASGGSAVDYVKMDVEGAERHLLRHNGWSDKIRSIAVELHAPYTVAECRRDLTRLGFSTQLHERHPLCVVGLRA